MNHTRTRSRWTHDVSRTVERIEQRFCGCPGFFDVAAVERRLSATSLAFRKVYLDAVMVQNSDHRFTNARKEVVHETRDE